MSHLHIACRLLNKAYLKQHRVYVLCSDKVNAEHLDELLWTFQDDSFIPHHLAGESDTMNAAIQIGWQPPSGGQYDLLMLVDTPLPESFQTFKRILVVVSHDEEFREQARILYRDLRQQGFEIDLHKLQ